MKKLIFLLLSIISISCYSQPKVDVIETECSYIVITNDSMLSELLLKDIRLMEYNNCYSTVLKANAVMYWFDNDDKYVIYRKIVN